MKIAFVYSLTLLIITLITWTSCSSEFDELAKSSKVNVVPLTNFNQFKRLVLEESENPVVLFVTVGASRIQQCPYCSLFRKVFQEVATRTRGQKVYWSLLEIEQNTQEIAMHLGLQQVPVVLLFKPGQSGAPVQCDLSSEQIHDFVKQHTGIPINISDEEIMKILASDPAFQQRQQPQQNEEGAGIFGLMTSLLKLIWQTSIVGLPLLLLILSVKYWSLISYRTLLAIAAYATFILCIGGTVYNMIHQTELFHFNPYTKQVMLIYPELRGQFVLEGYFAATLMIVGGVCLVAITQFLPMVQSSIMQRVFAMLLVSLFWLTFGSIFVIFSIKMGGYMQGTSIHHYVVLANALFGSGRQ